MAESVPLRDAPRRHWPGGVLVPWLLRQAEAIAFWLVVAPLLARLPPRLAYRAACWRGDLTLLAWPSKRAEVVSNLRQVLGEDLSEREAQVMVRAHFRLRACEVIDVMRLRGDAAPLGKLVEIRGREHLDAALAAGKGAILCSAHAGSFVSGFSLLHTSGYPVTTIGRWWWNYPPDKPNTLWRIWDFAFARRVLRHRQRPNIEPWPGRVQVAAQAAAALRGNEVVTICSDAPPLDAERSRAIEVPFLRGRARLLPGVVTLARLTGAPVLMAAMSRSADYRHQTLEISPPVPMDGETVAAFGRCVAAMDAAIMANPVEWNLWFKRRDLVDLGLLPDAARPEGPAGDRAELATPVPGSS